MKREIKVGFLEERSGVKSIARLGFVGITLYAMFMASWVYYSGNDVTATISIFSAIETFAVGLKLVQKGQENKTNKETLNNE